MEHGKNAQQRESEEFEQFDRHDTIQEAYAEHGKPVVRATSYGVEPFAEWNPLLYGLHSHHYHRLGHCLPRLRRDCSLLV
jgi:hypothetical protein